MLTTLDLCNNDIGRLICGDWWHNYTMCTGEDASTSEPSRSPSSHRERCPSLPHGVLILANCLRDHPTLTSVNLLKNRIDKTGVHALESALENNSKLISICGATNELLNLKAERLFIDDFALIGAEIRQSAKLRRLDIHNFLSTNCARKLRAAAREAILKRCKYNTRCMITQGTLIRIVGNDFHNNAMCRSIVRIFLALGRIGRYPTDSTGDGGHTSHKHTNLNQAMCQPRLKSLPHQIILLIVDMCTEQ